MGLKEYLGKAKQSVQAIAVQAILNRIARRVNKRVPVEEVRQKLSLQEYETPPVVNLRFVEPYNLNGALITTGVHLRRGQKVAELFLTTVGGRIRMLSADEIQKEGLTVTTTGWTTLGNAMAILKEEVDIDEAWAWDIVYFDSGEMVIQGDISLLRRLFSEHRGLIREVLAGSGASTSTPTTTRRPPPDGAGVARTTQTRLVAPPKA
ncbi:MAG: hypothetical protein KGJ23_08150 [Euryarchaeota archaeon]|nr:hypothetical protein [Euryarchaeota archaeon]MDE1836573.1 hypothetical protein [Euryarchaeota archaeon]MDE1879232.1 hypothetical protein [Euryarchaeota archaeon]MDE2044543.1 hypothetical protein [Thermoplasmata archaeon]